MAAPIVPKIDRQASCYKTSPNWHLTAAPPTSKFSNRRILTNFYLPASMGTAISAMRSAIKAGDEAEATKTKQNLEVLQKLVDAQLDKYEAHLDA